MRARERRSGFITPEGERTLRKELVFLWHEERPRVVKGVAEAAAEGDRSENAEYIYGKKKLREIDRRIHWLTKRLESAQLVDARDRPADERDRIFFGATVEVEDEGGKTATYTIVGEDEIDTARGRISYKSPIARVLLKKREGDTVLLRKPSGEIELTVVSVRYGAV
jgi:transcription elongation factor GreB